MAVQVFIGTGNYSENPSKKVRRSLQNSLDRSGITINCNLGTDTKKLQQVVDVPVALGMRYAQPSIEKGIQDLVDQGVNEIILFPLYPQYAMSTTETVSVKAEEVRRKNSLL